MRKEISSFRDDDRYIINRNNIDFDKSHLLITKQGSPSGKRGPSSSSSKIGLNLWDTNINKTKVLQSKIGPEWKLNENPGPEMLTKLMAKERKIRKYPIDIVQAHAASTQFFDNILDLSCKNMNAIALNNYVFLWDLNTNSYLSYERHRTTPLTCLSWKEDGTRLAISKSHHLGILGGPCKDILVRNINTDSAYCSMSWRNDLVTCGSNRSIVESYDLRRNTDKPTFRLCMNGKNKEKPESPVACVKWSPTGRYLVTSDPINSLNIWDILNLKTPLTTFTEHTSAVKDLAWCPYEASTLASGGGYFDGKIHVWNCNNGKVIASTSLNSQITGVIWSEADREILTAHARRGYNTQEEKFPNSKIHFWKYESSKKSSGHLQKLSHSLCNTEEISNVTSNQRFFLALSGFLCPKLYLWENIFNKVPTRLVKYNLTDLNKFK